MMSMRHLAWAQGTTALLGIALQAEHDFPEQRAQGAAAGPVGRQGPEPAVLTRMAELTEPCALMTSADGDGVVLGAARGLERWHARMLSWPVALVPDNHAVRLVA